MEKYIAIAVVAIVIFVMIAVLLKRRKKTKISVSNLSLPEGNYKVKGSKNNFIIVKDNRFVYKVVDGQIVSAFDKKRKHKRVLYREK